MSVALHTLRVFLGADGGGGNPLGVILEGGAVPAARRQAVAADLGFSETVFVDDRETGALRIFTPAVELPLAGHPLVGTAWLLAHAGDAGRDAPPAGGRRADVDGRRVDLDPRAGGVGAALRRRAARRRPPTWTR